MCVSKSIFYESNYPLSSVCLTAVVLNQGSIELMGFDKGVLRVQWERPQKH